jgi:beta-lactamase superfamily II metal-dependent hydrolase
MATAPQSISLRMYNVGFGDCFLLSFKYPKSTRHMLVDFGSTSAPKNPSKKTHYMVRVAEDIRKVCGGKLDVLVATHRHRDHVSGFSTDIATGKIIADLKPDHVIQPWTEDPRAKTTALTATSSIYTDGKPDAQKMTAHYLGALEDMHAIASAIKRASANPDLGGEKTRRQLEFVGDDNIKNPAAVRNLQQMGKRGKAYYVNAGMELNILPGVKCTVLGPPTLRQSDGIRKQRARDPDNFWQFRNFWGSQGLAARTVLAGQAKAMRSFEKDRGKLRAARISSLPPSVRWFVNQSRQIHVSQLLSLVRDLDSVMNNTSVILLLEVGKRRILLPGDAQIENWSYALSQPQWRKMLTDVSLYKVGHHGSLNATPKPLWGLFKNRGGKRTPDRLATVCSTKSGKHGSLQSGTEVPRKFLVAELKKNSYYTSSEEADDRFVTEMTLEC